MGDDHTPYFARRGDQVFVDEPMVPGETTRLLEMPISWTLDDHPHFEFFRAGNTLAPGLANASAVLENWLDDFRYMVRTHRVGECSPSPATPTSSAAATAC